MRKARKAMLAAGGAALALGLAGWQFAETALVALPGMILDWQSPIGPNHPVDLTDPGHAPVSRRGRPNIVLIVLDDLGFNDLTLNGGGLVLTPNIDRLASDGASFGQTYAASATCAPSRATIQTGRLPTRIGYEFTPTPPAMAPIVRFLEGAGESGQRFVFHQGREVPSFFDMAMPAEETTLAEMLAAGGYHTLHIGKWHLGSGAQTGPLGQGYRQSLELAGLLHAVPGTPGIVSAPQDFDPMDRVFFGSGRAAVTFQGSARFEPVGHLTEYFTDAAVQAIAANADRPFFLHLAYWAPHAPLQALQADYDALGAIPDHATRVYGAMLRGLDRAVGRVLAALDDAGIADETLVVLTSDNGGAHTIGLPQINAPYRGWKATLFEGGLRVPLLMRWPGAIAPGQTPAGRTHHADILPTLAAAAGVALPGPVDGIDLLPSLQAAAPLPERPFYFRSGHYEAILSEGWKLQRLTRPARLFLFDLTSDPYELRDRSASDPDQVARLTALLDAYAADLHEPLWPSSVEMRVDIDHPLGRPETGTGDFIFWPN